MSDPEPSKTFMELHPLRPFSGMLISCVEPGTVIERDGERKTVTDDDAVYDHGTIWVTEKGYKAIEAAIEKDAKRGA